MQHRHETETIMSFSNTVALVTGANRGIGRAFVEELLAAGAVKVYAAARNPEGLSDLVETGQGRVVAVALDVTKPDQIAAAAANKDVNLLINNAGFVSFAPLVGIDSIDGARDEMETNYFGVLNMVRAFAPVLAANGGGAIVNLGSIVSLASIPSIGSYSASKAALHSLTQGIRGELAGQGTHVAGVYPGPVDTDMAATVDMEKTSPREIAWAVLAGVMAGEEDIYPDPMSSDTHSALLADPKKVEKQFGAMTIG